MPGRLALPVLRRRRRAAGGPTRGGAGRRPAVMDRAPPSVVPAHGAVLPVTPARYPLCACR